MENIRSDATSMNTLRAPHPLHTPRERPARDASPRRRHRWILATVAIAAGLLVYGAGVGWFANRLADDLTATIQPIPALEDQQHRSD